MNLTRTGEKTIFLYTNSNFETVFYLHRKKEKTDQFWNWVCNTDSVFSKQTYSSLSCFEGRWLLLSSFCLFVSFKHKHLFLAEVVEVPCRDIGRTGSPSGTQVCFWHSRFLSASPAPPGRSWKELSRGVTRRWRCARLCPPLVLGSRKDTTGGASEKHSRLTSWGRRAINSTWVTDTW